MRDPETTDPTNPDPAQHGTLPPPMGVSADPDKTQQLNPTKLLEAGGTLRVPPLTVGAADQTLKFARHSADDPPIRLQRSDEPVEAAGQTQNLSIQPEPPKPLSWKLPLALGALVVVGAAGLLMSSRGASPAPVPSAAPRSEPAPVGAEVYFAQARAGDAHAMRMLGVMYYYGLNVPQDREKGLYWYRKAAEKGSDVARGELNKLEAAGK